MAKRIVTKRTPRARKSNAGELIKPVPELPPALPQFQADATVPDAAEAGNVETSMRGRITLFTFTLAAALLGVALGFYLGSEAAKSAAPTTPVQTTTPGTIDAERARKVLVLLQEELVENAKILKQQRELQHGGKADPSVTFQFVKNDLWRAIVNNGDIQAVRDLDLLQTIATAYRFIDEIRMLERQTIESTSLAGISATTKETARTLSVTLARTAALAEKSTVEAAVMIDHKINAKQ
jgi:hypothetical protein